MALQVRPESTQPASNPRISSKSASAMGRRFSRFHQGPRFNTALQGRIYGCDLSCERPISRKGLAQGGTSIYGFFGAPGGLGLATATTSAAFFPHLEQRIGCASSFWSVDRFTPALRQVTAISATQTRRYSHPNRERR